MGRLTWRAILVAAPCMLLPLPAGAALDLLNVPALQSRLAEKSMLLAVTRAGQRLVAVGERGIIVYSDDSGSSWTQANVPVSVTLTAVQFVSAGKGWAVGHDGVVLHSQDGGANWVKQFDGNDANKLVIAELTSRLKKYENASPGANDAMLNAARAALDEARESTDFGPSSPLLGLSFRDEADGIVVGAFGQLFHTANGGRHWESWGARIDNPEGLHYNAISRQPDGTLVISGEGGKLRRSRDAGATWESLDTRYAGQLYGSVALATGKVLISYGFAGSIYRSEDDGKTWQALPRLTTKPLIGAMLLPGDTLVLVDRDRRQLVSRDLGRSFVSGGTPGRPIATLLPDLHQGKLVVSGAGGVSFLTLDRTGN